MDRCAYVYKRANKDYQANERCRVFPKNGKFCYKHSKSKLQAQPQPKPIIKKKKVTSVKTTLPPRRGFEPVDSVDESNMPSVMQFADDEEAKKLRMSYANKRPDSDDELTDISDEEDTPKKPVQVIIENEDGTEHVMSDDGAEEDAQKANNAQWGSEDNPLHPINLAKVGAELMLDAAEDWLELPHYKVNIINIPAWSSALDELLRRYLADFTVPPPEYVVVGIPLAMILRMKMQKKTEKISAQTTPPEDGNTEYSSGSELGTSGGLQTPQLFVD